MKTLAKVQGRTEQLLGYRVDKVSDTSREKLLSDENPDIKTPAAAGRGDYSDLDYDCGILFLSSPPGITTGIVVCMWSCVCVCVCVRPA
ncbi:hypothetical protein KUCAC02_030397 [Chaenocephalus aceratus]|uniref:Uncharacterized protein n=1 Tax=Chaenocephalus aceratus TaxID=36190 RepID=A0ACB9XJY5_CHAAC|nr:hypothetical protein KUCAC02_030397 [Chaenocephalus aceratus]